MFLMAEYIGNLERAKNARNILHEISSYFVDTEERFIWEEESLNDQDDFIRKADEMSFNDLLHLMRKYDITMKQLDNICHCRGPKNLDSYYSTGMVKDIGNAAAFRKKLLKMAKDKLKILDKDSQDYKKVMSLYGKLKMVSDPKQICKIMEAHDFTMNGEMSDRTHYEVYESFEEYVQDVFDNK